MIWVFWFGRLAAAVAIEDKTTRPQEWRSARLVNKTIESPTWKLFQYQSHPLGLRSIRPRYIIMRRKRFYRRRFGQRLMTVGVIVGYPHTRTQLVVKSRDGSALTNRPTNRWTRRTAKRRAELDVIFDANRIIFYICIILIMSVIKTLNDRINKVQFFFRTLFFLLHDDVSHTSIWQ